jgi:hypothetical protein
MLLNQPSLRSDDIHIHSAPSHLRKFGGMIYPVNSVGFVPTDLAER